jgi:hypothetical protein
MPLWAAVALVAAAYLYRSIARGFDFSLDWPIDVILLGTFVLLLVAVGLARRSRAADGGGDGVPGQVQDEDQDADGGGEKQDVFDQVE